MGGYGLPVAATHRGRGRTLSLGIIIKGQLGSEHRQREARCDVPERAPEQSGEPLLKISIERDEPLGSRGHRPVLLVVTLVVERPYEDGGELSGDVARGLAQVNRPVPLPGPELVQRIREPKRRADPVAPLRALIPARAQQRRQLAPRFQLLLEQAAVRSHRRRAGRLRLRRHVRLGEVRELTLVIRV